MPASLDYAAALALLGRSRWFGMKPGLERMRRLAARLDDPQRSLRFLHLAGTNGKGSTAAFAESVLRAHGLRVGLYTSPHLIEVRERMQIDRTPIPPEAFAAAMTRVRDAGAEEEEATFFELTTLTALTHFAREKVDAVVWETGLGGRLDATNIVEPMVTVITPVALDHQRYLGETLAEIAGEKAGIIKSGVPVVLATQEPEAAVVLRKTAAQQQAPVLTPQAHNLGLRAGIQWASLDGEDFALGLIGAHQVENAALGRRAAELFLEQTRLVFVEPKAIAQGLSHTNWPGRFEVLSRTPLVVLDGAHNPAGAAALALTWRDFLASNGSDPANTHLVFGAVSDKALAEIAAEVRPLAARVSLVRLASERGVPPEQLAPHFAGLPCRTFASVAEAMADLVEARVPVLITGSLFLVGEVLAHRQGRTADYQANEQLERTAPRA